MFIFSRRLDRRRVTGNTFDRSRHRLRPAQHAIFQFGFSISTTTSRLKFHWRGKGRVLAARGTEDHRFAAAHFDQPLFDTSLSRFAPGTYHLTVIVTNANGKIKTLSHFPEMRFLKSMLAEMRPPPFLYLNLTLSGNLTFVKRRVGFLSSRFVLRSGYR
jgi:hypothetical protein